LAIYEASFRPNIRFVPVKTEEQQEILMLHRVRERLVKEKTACTYQIRGVLVDFEICFAQGYKAFVASIGRGQAFNTAKELGVWLGLTPKQFASGHRSVNGCIPNEATAIYASRLFMAPEQSSAMRVKNKMI
jgi:transposase